MTTGLLVMAYGTPKDLEDVERYYTDIRHGRPPPPELLEELTDRYRAIGGRSPLLELTFAQARGIGERVGAKAYIGQKHSPPSIPDALTAMAADGVESAVGIVLAPHYSRMSIGDYQRRARRAAEGAGWSGELKIVDSWHLEPGYIRWLGARVREALVTLPDELREDARVVFSAHSLPVKILESGDPYPDQLRATAEAVAADVGLGHWSVGWQSAGRTEQEWLGPDILEILDLCAEQGERAVVVCPAGFVADHLEVLYDVDIEAQQHAAKLGIELRRTRSPNDDPGFLDAVAAVVARHL
jgi:ferrochelatase